MNQINMDLEERGKNLSKLTTPDQAGKNLQNKLLKLLNDPEVPKSQRYKEGMTIGNLVEMRSCDRSRKTMDEFVLDNAIREHLERLILPTLRKQDGQGRALKIVTTMSQDNQNKLRELESKLLLVQQIESRQTETIGMIRKMKAEQDQFKDKMITRCNTFENELSVQKKKILNLEEKFGELFTVFSRPDLKMEVFS